MEKKIQKKYIDMGFGFPVHLLNVPMVKVRGHWTPHINYSGLSDIVLNMIVLKKSKLTGDELKFIRNKFEMTLLDFAEKFYVTHPAVLKWEAQKDEPTNMNWATEKDIRLYAYATLNGDDFYKVYKELRVQATSRKLNTRIDVKKRKSVLLSA